MSTLLDRRREISNAFPYHNLPADYVQLEYLRFKNRNGNGNSRIPISNLGSLNPDKVVVKTAYKTYIGAGGRFSNVIELGFTNGTIYLQNGQLVERINGNTCGLTKTYDNLGQKTEVTLEMTGLHANKCMHRLYRSGTDTITKQGSYPGKIINGWFAWNFDCTYNPADIGFYEVFIYADTKLWCHMIPAKRISDNVVGLYCTRNGSFNLPTLPLDPNLCPELNTESGGGINA